MTSLTLRPATFDDAALIARLHTESWQNSYRKILSDDYLDHVAPTERHTMWTRRFHYDNHLWVQLALWDGEPVGFVCLLPDGETERGLLLDNLHVLPGQQGRGVGRTLLLAAAAEAHRLQAGTPMHLWVYEANSDARRFYNRMGGEMVDRESVLAPDGSKAVALCYRWKQPALLAGSGSVAA
ncbi:GNAT family N-acetyltransferase [Aquitalea sp. USM4]|uniref:GNAT family N-acetyltransferase n=1 Tax=Aquitalea sp. USM4 TaxID=1590041 RepID=UPI00103B5972|nr:GNAT family N-acetyltransferase [Aquitalea sp. USM4]QBJ78072.1 GNAT family N-acetyltransferase [Aquitalea sp. USM4]